MASKPVYTVVAITGILALSGAAWWYQNRAGSPVAAGVTPGQGASAPARPASGAGGGMPTVEVASVQVMKLIDDTQAVGSLRSRRSVVLRPEVSGRITQLNFRDGERVRKGQLLVQFDDQLPQAQVQQSQAELSIARANHQRNQELVAEGFISKRSVDESSANLEVANAKLALARATAQRLRIIAPFDGIAGIRSVNVGDYLKDGADVVNIEDLDAVFVDFRLPERFQSKVRRGQTAGVELDALPGRKFAAVIQAVDPLIDANGRSVSVRGCIDNRQLQLRPGMFARVNAVFGERDNALVVPEEAIVPQGNRQFVIRLVEGEGGAKTTQRVEVKVGIRRPGRVEIADGLKEGDRVLTAGQQRVQRDGTAVRVVDVAAAGGVGGAGRGEGGRAGTGAGAGAGAGASTAPAVPASGASAMASGVATSAVSPAPAVAARAAAVPPSGPNPCVIGMAEIPKAAAVRAPGRNPAPSGAAPAATPRGMPSRDPA